MLRFMPTGGERAYDPKKEKDIFLRLERPLPKHFCEICYMPQWRLKCQEKMFRTWGLEES